MSYWLILIPLFSAVLGWFLTWCFLAMLFHPRLPVKRFGRSFQGVIPKRMPELSERVGNLLRVEFAFFDDLEEKIIQPGILQKITPEIEQHIDHFLRVKLKDAMPMVAMFVGDRTITQMKEIFMAEMEILFPVIMKNFVNELQSELNIQEIITARLASVPASKIEFFILKTLGKEFRYVQSAGAILGLVIGVFAVIATLLIRS